MRRIVMPIRLVAMPRLKAVVTAAAVTASLCACYARAACVADSMPARPHLVELYSSEGCSSCPPAESWLRTLHAGADVVPLEFHVDYWDDLGWKDRFSDARYTARQNEQAHRDGGTSVFTPQIVLDGHNWSGWYRGGHLTPPGQAGIAMHLSAETAAGRVHAESTSRPIAGQQFDGYHSYVVLVEDGLETQVRAGENRGTLLKHDHVVRAFSGPLPLARATFDLPIPSGTNLDAATLVAFVQSPRTGDVAQVTVLPLARCPG
jgi:hypothetical protein